MLVSLTIISIFFGCIFYYFNKTKIINYAHNPVSNINNNFFSYDNSDIVITNTIDITLKKNNEISKKKNLSKLNTSNTPNSLKTNNIEINYNTKKCNLNMPWDEEIDEIYKFKHCDSIVL